MFGPMRGSRRQTPHRTTLITDYNEQDSRFKTGSNHNSRHHALDSVCKVYGLFTQSNEEGHGLLVIGRRCSLRTPSGPRRSCGIHDGVAGRRGMIHKYAL
jgi:hypothetical protein